MEKQVLCPICNGDYNHIVKCEVENYKENNKIVITSNELSLIDNQCNSRGVNILIYYRCEQGHSFIKESKFYKGCTYESVRTGDYIGNAIWRD